MWRVCVCVGGGYSARGMCGKIFLSGVAIWDRVQPPTHTHHAIPELWLTSVDHCMATAIVNTHNRWVIRRNLSKDAIKTCHVEANQYKSLSCPPLATGNPGRPLYP